MGFDIHGTRYAKERDAIHEQLKPRDIEESKRDELYDALNAIDLKPGAYFRRSIWTWHQLWDCVCDVAGISPKQRDLGHHNWAYEADEKEALRIEKAIRDSIQQEVAQGILATSAVGVIEEAKIWQDKGVKQCGSFVQTQKDLLEFADFLHECGGFSID
jgi:hypothetical protein